MKTASSSNGAPGQRDPVVSDFGTLSVAPYGRGPPASQETRKPYLSHAHSQDVAMASPWEQDVQVLPPTSGPRPRARPPPPRSVSLPIVMNNPPPPPTHQYSLNTHDVEVELQHVLDKRSSIGGEEDKPLQTPRGTASTEKKDSKDTTFQAAVYQTKAEDARNVRLNCASLRIMGRLFRTGRLPRLGLLHVL